MNRSAITGAIWLMAFVAALAGFRYGLPPKEGPVTETIWWFPFAFPIFVGLQGPVLIGMCLALLQFPALAAAMTFGLRKWPVKWVLLSALALYLGAVALRALMVKLTGIGAH